MPIMQKIHACPTCGAVVVFQVSQGEGEPFEGIDNEQAHAQWHADLDKRFAALGEWQVHPRPQG